MSRRPALFTQAAVSRALNAMQKAQYDGILEIAPSGVIRILPAEPAGITGRSKEFRIDEDEPVEL